MPRGGNRPGAGRKRGAVAKLSTTRVERAVQEGMDLPPEELLALAHEAMVMVAHYRAAMSQDPKTRLVNEERYAFWMYRAGEFFKAAAPYYAPRLHAMMAEVHHKAEVSISQKLETNATPQEAMQAYIKMIDAKPL